MTQETAIGRRRNGRQQACEPCRKRKVACDHSLPVCQRCRKLRRGADCVYIENPEAKERASKTASPTPVFNFASRPSNTPNNDTPASSRKGDTRDEQTSLFSVPTSFFGATSFSDVFFENQHDLEDSNATEHAGIATNMSSDLPENDADNQFDIDPELISRGVIILRQIPNESTCNALLARFRTTNDVLFQLTSRLVSESFWNMFRRQLSSGKESDLQSIVSLVCQNSMTVLHDADDGQEWLASFTGQNMRWEAVGLLLTYWAHGACVTFEHDALFNPQFGVSKDRKQMMAELKSGADACIAMLSRNSHANTLIAGVMYKLTLFESIVSGDSSLVLWRQHGTLCAMATSLGLHRDVDPVPYRFSFRAEMRRRVYWVIFNIDKVISTFNGRPPLLSRRYTSTPLPLDIDDETLYSSSDLAETAIARLDARGWNTDGRLLAATVGRARTMLALIRDEALEIVLGSPITDMAARITDLQNQSINAYNSLPAIMQWRQSDMQNPQITSETINRTLMMRTENLQNLFILERLSLSKNGTGACNTQRLFDISKEILSAILVPWRTRDDKHNWDCDHSFLSLYLGVPASGILCVALVDQVKGCPDSNLVIPRSETIQNLSAFVEYLSWMKEPEANATLCHRIRDIIAKVLDRVLNHVPSSASKKYTSMQAPSNSEAALGTPISNAPGFENMGSFGMMETFDWADFTPTYDFFTDTTFDDVWSRLERP